jgi:hypothetical protein
MEGMGSGEADGLGVSGARGRRRLFKFGGRSSEAGDVRCVEERDGRDHWRCRTVEVAPRSSVDEGGERRRRRFSGRTGCAESKGRRSGRSGRERGEEQLCNVALRA